MYWWLGIWMGVVAVALGSVAFSVYAQMMDWDMQKVVDWLRGAPDGWGPRTLRGWQAGRKWAGGMAAFVSSGVSLIASGKWPDFRAWMKSMKGSGKKVDASFYRGLYRSVCKNKSAPPPL